jgi:hypothetical protein
MKQRLVYVIGVLDLHTGVVGRMGDDLYWGS